MCFDKCLEWGEGVGRETVLFGMRVEGEEFWVFIGEVVPSVDSVGLFCFGC